ncbi:thiol reductant ABC exporter subunit CydD [Cohaesibacter gelatinilyticus]|uniref:ATP-binding cassette, subfamily C, CydD n=1 Tax=Cohaesibacter gelatinilyticus TaxID=372072 RepID=A0A285NH11_9HYPH|nr:thiol reductant ABC exporter subunit CydD [Cohaesibacter gelatinilyticus]SNZ06941.1 ATP-binding cassette, subfamily C, CydD [Cohaesibacter gelatinilyticus]
MTGMETRDKSEETSHSSDTEAPKGRKGRKPRQKNPADQWLGKIVDPYKGQLKHKARLETLSGVLAIAQAGFLAFGIGALIEDGGGILGLVPYLVGLIITILARTALSYLAGKLGHTISADLRFSLRQKLASILASQSPLDIERRSAGEVAALASDVIENLDPYTSRYLSLRLQLTVIPLAILIAVTLFSWAAALVLLLCGPLIPVFMAIVGIRAKKASDKQVAALSTMSSRFLDRLQGMTTLRLFGAVGRTRDLFDGIATDYRKATMKVLRIAFLSSAALELFSALGIALIAIYVGYHYLGFTAFGSYDSPITLSSGLFMLLLAPEFFTPLRDFAAAYHDRASAQSAAERLMLLLPEDKIAEESEADTSSTTKASAAASPIKKITFEDCSFGYEGGRDAILSNVNITLSAGSRIAILGRSGSGKSTLLAALCGLLKPLEGRLLLNEQAVSNSREEWVNWRQSIGWIGQKPHIFHGSLLMNARLAHPDASREAVDEALSQAHADQFVAQLPRDLLTILGETGFGISGGQVRRLAIARAALGDSSLILCDEPTADLDADTAKLVTQSLLKMAKDRLLVIATHDRDVAEQCDHIYFVKDGSLSEISKPDLADLENLLSDEPVAPSTSEVIEGETKSEEVVS